jgi:dTMP kinase
MFITFEGVEGSGKSTLAASVQHALHSAGYDVVVTREPGGTPVGDAVRSIFLQPGLAIDAITETLLINASRAQLVTDVIAPAIARGSVVLCDRYVHSTLAYQGFGRGLSIELVRAICDAATGGLMPDLTLLADVDRETSRRRLAARGNGADRVESEGDAFHARVRDGFLELARRDPSMVVLDGRRSEEQVLDAAMAALSALIE